ncbi:hypothetical protein ACWFRJ_34005 [Streptomyces sp. NPDC055239]
MRYAVQDIALAQGPVIRQGEAILASYAAAGRHPASTARAPVPST